MRLSSAIFTTLAIAEIFSSALAVRANGADGLRILTDLPSGTWIENLAVRSNGRVLITILTAPQLLQIDPTAGTSSFLIHEFAETNGTINVVETSPDRFVVTTANISDFPVPGSFQAWTIDLTAFDGGTRESVTSGLVADIDEATFLNGMVALDRDTVLIGDSSLGVVFKLNILTGIREIVLDDPLMKATNSAVPLGINGMKLSKTPTGGTLFFENTGMGVLARIPINADGTAAAPAEIVADTGVGDDFDIDDQDNVFIAVPNELRMVSASDGSVVVVAGAEDETILAGGTAVRLGRGGQENGILYVSTNGGLRSPVNGTAVPGHVVAVDFGAFLDNARGGNSNGNGKNKGGN